MLGVVGDRRGQLWQILKAAVGRSSHLSKGEPLPGGLVPRDPKKVSRTLLPSPGIGEPQKQERSQNSLTALRAVRSSKRAYKISLLA